MYIRNFFYWKLVRSNEIYIYQFNLSSLDERGELIKVLRRLN